MARMRWFIGLSLVVACGDSGTGGSTGTTGDTSTGSSGGGSTTVVDSTGEPLPTTGGSQSASGTSSTGPIFETTTTGTSTGEPLVTSTGPDETSSGDDGTTTGDTSSSSGDTSSGAPVCDPLVLCGDDCVDTDLDPAHCGGCDNACADDQICLDGQCAQLVCDPNTMVPCYTGDPGTEDVGTCKGGSQVCNDLGTELGPCVGEVVPAAENCDTPDDEECDGVANQGCYLKNCAEILQAEPGSPDGDYMIDLDGDDGPIGPFFVRCDMTTQGGGWTRFNWLHTKYTAGQDPLGQTLQECNVKDLQCRGRIPAGAVKDLLIKDLNDATHAMWTFNNSTISNAVLAALQSKVQYCGANQGAFNPIVSTSVEAYCGNGQEGGCDSFYYTSGACQNVGNWGIHWDGDNAWCAAAVKMGATWAGGCGHDDQGFLNECACDDENGEMYYR